MKLYYAHYPALEKHFVSWLGTQRSSVVDKWLVVCASSWIAQHLQTRLARQWGGIANIHFVTGSSLVGRLDQEAPGDTLPLLPQDHVRDFLIQEILAQPGLNRYPISHGFVQTVKSALRDLADSMADPAVLEEHLQSLPDYVLEEDDGRFSWLIQLYKRYSELENNVPGYRSYQNAFERALAQVEKSTYLQSFSHIVIYGFYDMPGRQWELFDRLCAHYPVTVFAPYEKHLAYHFAQKFFETNWMRSPGAQDVNMPLLTALGHSGAYLFTGTGGAHNERVNTVSVPDIQGAIFYVAKEISKLLAQGYRGSDIAVITRTLEPYQDEIRQVFKENCIALNASFTYPIYKNALGRFCLNLLELTASGFSREKVLAVFSSPYLQVSNKEAWVRAVNHCLVKRDLSQWKDLFPQTTPLEREVWKWIEQTARQLDQLMQTQSWEKGVEQVLTFLEERVNRTAFQGQDESIYQQIREAILKIKVYQSLRPQSRQGECLKQIVEAIRCLTFNEVEAVPNGVVITDAVRARGLTFKRVFILGLNDREFPLVVAEDPILRDYYRYQLRDTLGYWINASLDRADEEKILFYNALSTAQERLEVIYYRYTADGKPAVPSLFLVELARCCELNLQASDAPRVSGRLKDRLSRCPLSLLTSKELSLQLVLQGIRQAQEGYQQAGLFNKSKGRSLEAIEAISKPGTLGAYDGLIQSGEQIFTRENKHGFSPSALQELGACPFKYFLNRGLHLGEPEEPADRQSLPSNKQGTMYHEILQEFYNTLLHTKAQTDLFASGAVAVLEEIIARRCQPDAYRLFGIYPVVWEIIIENIREKLIQFVQQDLIELGQFVPHYFEKEMTCPANKEVPVCLRGIIDRIDVDMPNRQFRIVDYKSRKKGSSNLAKDFFTLLIFQPVLYVWLAKQIKELKKYMFAESCLLSIDPYSKRDLPVAVWEEIQPRVTRFLVQLTNYIRNGQFFINPGLQCTYCPYHLICRKDAFRPLMRAQQSTLYKALEEAQSYDA